MGAQSVQSRNAYKSMMSRQCGSGFRVPLCGLGMTAQRTAEFVNPNSEPDRLRIRPEPPPTARQPRIHKASFRCPIHRASSSAPMPLGKPHNKTSSAPTARPARYVPCSPSPCRRGRADRRRGSGAGRRRALRPGAHNRAKSSRRPRRPR